MFIDSIVGWASLVIGIAGYINSSNVPNAKVRVQLVAAKNQPDGGPSDDGGHIPEIVLRGTAGEYLGQYHPNMFSPAKLKANQYWNYDISSAVPVELKSLDVQMAYTTTGPPTGETVRRSLDDGLCLAHMSWAPDQSMFNYAARAGAITGDLLYYCGYSWYNSGQYFEGVHMRCGWLDGDNSNGNSVHRMLLNTDILGRGHIKSYSERYPNVQDICYWGVGFSGGSSPHRRSVTPTSTYGDKAYVTARGGAIELCDSPTSWGPSMLSLEQGIFCDMTTKTKIPMCTQGSQEKGCVKYQRIQSRGSMSASRTLQARNVSSDDISYSTYELEYFTLSDINGTVIDDGTNY